MNPRHGWRYMNCEYCGDRLCTSGGARAAHYKKHARARGLHLEGRCTVEEIQKRLATSRVPMKENP